MDEEIEKGIEESENVPGTWDYELKKHWDSFSEACWIGFNKCCEDMLKYGHENKINAWKWRDYILYDMQKRHQKEKKK